MILKQLLHEICTYLEPPDLKCLRAVSSYLNEVTSSVLFSQLRIYLAKENPSTSLVKALASGETSVYQYVRTLHVCPERTPWPSDMKIYFPESLDRWHLETYLAQALKSLTSLRSIEWKIGQNHLKYVQLEDTWESLPSLPWLENATFHLWAPTLPVLSRLQSLEVEFAYSTEISSQLFTTAVATSVSSNRSLTTLSMTLRDIKPGEWATPPRQCASFRDFALALDVEAPLRLESLTLRGWEVIIDDVTLPVFCAIRHLNLQGKYDNVVPSESWRLLAEQKIPLSTFGSASITFPLLGYLESYSGLIALELSPDFDVDPPRRIHPGVDPMTWIKDADSDVAAEYFYFHVLPRHTESLQCLRITPRWEGAWCFRICYGPLISQCAHLVTLQLAIDFDHRVEFVPYDPVLNPVTALLNIVVDLPHLKYLHVSEATQREARNIRCWNGWTNRSARTKIKTSITEFEPACPERYRYFHLSCVFRPFRMANIDGEKWRFQQMPRPPVWIDGYPMDVEYGDSD